MNRGRLKGLRVVDLARIMGVCRQQARNYINFRSLPKGDKQLVLASLLGISVEELLARYSENIRAKRAA